MLLITFLALLATCCSLASATFFFSSNTSLREAILQNNVVEVIRQAPLACETSIVKLLKEFAGDVAGRAGSIFLLARQLSDQVQAIKYVCQAYPHLGNKAAADQWLVIRSDSDKFRLPLNSPSLQDQMF